MRERLTRRKKKTPEEASQPAPPPLQPAYFDAGEAPAHEAPAPVFSADQEPETISRPGRGRSAASRPASNQEDAPEDLASAEHDSQPAAEPQAGASELPRPSRPVGSGRPQRGKRRGGRGRGGRSREQGGAPALAQSAVKGSTSSAEEGESRDAEAATPRVSSLVPAAPRAPKGIVVLAIGLPGSGKSSWFKRNSIVPLSSDMMRTLLFDDIREQRFQDLVFSNLRSMLKARLIAKRPMNYVDATNLTPQERQHWIKLAKDYGYEVHALFFDVPLDVCLERHQRRDLVVPEDIMRRMAAKLKAPAFTEGFAKITVVRVKKKEE